MGQSLRTFPRTSPRVATVRVATVRVATVLVATLAMSIGVAVGPSAAGAGGPTADGAAASRTDRPYRAVDLGFAATEWSLAINDRGQVVGGGHLWQAGELTPLGAPDGFDRFHAAEINEAGMVVGNAITATGLSQVAVWHRGAFTTIEIPDAGSSYAVSINDLGVVFGTAEVTSPDQSFLWHRGELTMLWHNNAYAAQTGINNWGDIVGEYEPTPGYPCNCRGYRWHRGVRTDLGTLGGDGLWPNQPADVNNRREIVGGSTTADRQWHAYLWRDGAIRDLGTLGGADSSAVAISDRGVVIGHADTATGASHPFRWQHGTMVDLTTLGLRPTDRVVDVNVRGQIVGIRDGRATLFVR
ncbi:hypothetical protein O7608_05115 [Solwaraspora sp. WMMA2056]|uniref:hypothetical protein n=1 Tax=Solwaraspora sp. WMMA2056 TaxID=3015161 RepID=UPI00259BBE89|nr:hypothetical protein [Solwaraspora sp. WMMA2056]WJK41798.1 hypothetical protein O7608_05115 [Solwaraspora sp. WMMA2056]